MNPIHELVYEKRLTLTESCDYMTRWTSVFDKYAEIMQDTITHLPETAGGGEAEKVDLRGKSKQLNESLVVFEGKLKRTRTMQETSEIVRLNNERRKQFSSIKTFIRINRNLGNEAHRQAADRLYKQGLNFKPSRIKTYADMTKSIQVYLALLSSKQNEADVTTLGLAEYIELLDDINNEFIVLYTQRSTYQEEQGVAASSIYKDCYVQFSRLLTFLNSIYLYYTHEQFTAFANELNGITSGYQLIINNRQADSKRVKIMPMEKTIDEIIQDAEE